LDDILPAPAASTSAREDAAHAAFQAQHTHTYIQTTVNQVVELNQAIKSCRINNKYITCIQGGAGAGKSVRVLVVWV
jgi:hypothetical protein